MPIHQIITTSGVEFVEIPEPTPEEIEIENLKKIEALKELLRSIRDTALLQSDWTQVVDAPFTSEVKTQWAVYRQALRDLPLHANWPNLEYSDWPTDPNGNKPIPTP